MITAKCPFANRCRYYDKDGFVCNQDDPVNLIFCGKYREWLQWELAKNFNGDVCLESLGYKFKSELYHE